VNKDVYNSISDKAKEVETVQVHLQDEDERLVKTVMLKWLKITEPVILLLSKSDALK